MKKDKKEKEVIDIITLSLKDFENLQAAIQKFRSGFDDSYCDDESLEITIKSDGTIHVSGNMIFRDMIRIY